MGVAPIAVPQKLAFAIDQAGDKSDVDFDYLLQTAIRESSLNPSARAPTSSATGLFQFLDSTWLQVMKQEGPRLGYQAYADAIQIDRDGDYFIADKAMRKEVLKLREDPQVSADLAAAFTRSNGQYLQARFGRMPSPGELYIAHFLGAQGAEKFFNAGLHDPDAVAAKLFPRQARANPTIFYDQGEARTIREVYKVLVAKHVGAVPVAVDPVFSAQQLASQPEVPPPDDVPPDPPLPGNEDLPLEPLPAAQAIPSRYAGDPISFTTLFANQSAIPGRVLISPSEESQGSVLFTQLYGQGR